MNSKITIIMYHYVRDINNSRYPKIKGLELSDFKEQILFLKQHYNIITMERLLESIDLKSSLPERAALLTFDDGYIDHFTNVFPVLLNNNLQGSFFIPAKVVKENRMLDVNKIHYILASCQNIDFILSDLKILIIKYQLQYNLKSFDYYFNKLAKFNRFDDEKIIFVKRLLQVELEDKIREIFIKILFEKYVEISETNLSKELYLNIDQIKCMKNSGMHIGAHGFEHIWLGESSTQVQNNEISQSIDFLKSIEVDEDKWTLCYPYGSYDDNLIKLLFEKKCKAAFTTNVNIANIFTENRLTLSRLDTNDFPKNRNAIKNDWMLNELM